MDSSAPHPLHLHFHFHPLSDVHEECYQSHCGDQRILCHWSALADAQLYVLAFAPFVEILALTQLNSPLFVPGFVAALVAPVVGEPPQVVHPVKVQEPYPILYDSVLILEEYSPYL